MIQNLILSVNVVVPLFLEMILGFFLNKVHLMEHDVAQALNRLVFKCLLPILLFYNIYCADFNTLNDPTYMAVAICMILGSCGLMMLIVPRLVHDRKKCGAIVQACFRSNYVLFGIPLVELLVGSDHLGPASLLITVTIPFYNMLSVIVLEHYRGGKSDLKKTLKGIVTNPLIIAAVIAIIVQLLHIHLISCVETAVSAVSKSATPIALMVMGAEFRIDAVKDYWKELTGTLIFRLLIYPAIGLTIAAMIGVRGDQFVALMIMLAAPVAVSSYTMAEMMDSDGVLASQLVFYSTMLSSLSLFLIIFVTKSLGLF